MHASGAGVGQQKSIRSTVGALRVSQHISKRKTHHTPSAMELESYLQRDALIALDLTSNTAGPAARDRRSAVEHMCSAAGVPKPRGDPSARQPLAERRRAVTQDPYGTPAAVKHRDRHWGTSHYSSGATAAASRQLHGIDACDDWRQATAHGPPATMARVHGQKAAPLARGLDRARQEQPPHLRRWPRMGSRR
jgi:hypothetical protein